VFFAREMGDSERPTRAIALLSPPRRRSRGCRADMFPGIQDAVTSMEASQMSRRLTTRTVLSCEATLHNSTYRNHQQSYYEHVSPQSRTLRCSSMPQLGTYQQTACGAISSQLDEGGCVRTRCTSGADCANDELCFPGPVIAQVGRNARFDPVCTTDSTGRCECIGKTIANGAGAYCLPKSTVMGSWGCVWDSDLNYHCPAFAEWISEAKALLASLSLYETTATGAQSCIIAAEEKFAKLCPQ
jgi:hypothetical protein